MVEVRSATSDDAERVFEMVDDFATSYRPDRAAFEQSYRVIAAREESELLVADDDDGIIGYLLAADMPTLFANGPVTKLLELYVSPGSRRSGVASMLVRQAVRHAGDRGSVEVTVPTRRARNFYLAVGFEPTAEYFKLKLGQDGSG